MIKINKMNKIWVYTIIFFWEEDEYGYPIYQGSFIEVFFSKESAEKWKKDFEQPNNINYICYQNDWHSKSSFKSLIEEKEILNY